MALALLAFPGTVFAQRSGAPSAACSKLETTPDPAIFSGALDEGVDFYVRVILDSAPCSGPGFGTPVTGDSVIVHEINPDVEADKETIEAYEVGNGEYETGFDACWVYGCGHGPVWGSPEVYAEDEGGFKINPVVEDILYEMPSKDKIASVSVQGAYPLDGTASGGTGTGSLVLGPVPSPSTPPTTFQSDGIYFDVGLSAGNGFEELEFTVCGIPSASPPPQLYWLETPTTSRLAYKQGPYSSGCITAQLKNGSPYVPELNQIDGAVFGVGTPAFGTAPEIGRCVKVPKGSGKYKDAGCEKGEVKEKGNYEWEAGPPPKNKFTSEEGASEFRAVGGLTITCTSGTDIGEYVVGASNKTDAETMTFHGCKSGASECTTPGQADGTIVTKTLTSVLGVIKGPKTLGVDLEGPSGVFAEFECSGHPVVISGSVIAPVKASKMELAYTEKFKATKGKQKPEQFEDGAKDTLTCSSAALLPAPEQCGFTSTDAVANEEELEFNDAL